MNDTVLWYLVIGFVLTLVGLSTSYFEKLPVTTSIVYFLFGAFIGNAGLQMIDYDLSRQASFFERLTELVVIVSLFSAGLKLRLPFKDANWIPSIRLAFGSMVITVALITGISVWLFDFSLGAGILLGGILAPTDPVLASSVQVKHPEDRDRLRFSLTGEAGLNDGTAFPFVMLGLGLLGLHEIGPWGVRWLLVDVVWAVVAGLAIGWISGIQVSKLVIFLRKKSEETIILDDFLTFGLISLSYGLALAVHAYGFLAVFAAGLAMRKIGNQKQSEAITSSQEAPTTTVKAVLSFTEQMERIGEVFAVIFLGAMFSWAGFWHRDLWLIFFLLVFVRPISVLVGLIKVPMGTFQRPLISWFGIRGIGSIYYLSYAISKGLPPDLAARLEIITYSAVVASIFIHGISGLPFMSLYLRREEARANG